MKRALIAPTALFLLTIAPASLLAAATQPAKEPPMQPLARQSFDIPALAKDFPPIIKNTNIRYLYDLIAASSAKNEGTLIYSRWAAMPLPQSVPDSKPAFEARPDFFTYDAPAAGTVEWHLNFADRDLFAYYGGGLFAQDEMQVAEHPILASLREALLQKKLSTFTTEGTKSTPILIRGVPRRASVATAPNATEFRPSGLYGNQFARATPEAIRRATTLLNPPTTSNLIAMEAPANGRGDYTADQIRTILTIACTAYRAAQIESQTAGQPAPKITIHTGFWGCGAYGGNRVLMTTLQLLAARLAGVDRLVYHTGDKAGLAPFNDGQKLLDDTLKETTNTQAIITKLAARKFPWGTSDGN